MKLYFKDTAMSYREITNLLTSHIGPAGPNTWHNRTEKTSKEYLGYVEIYDNHPAAVFVWWEW
jgi:hypothetical protein